MREEIAEVFVQPYENVLNLATARTESVANIVHSGITDGEKIGSAGLAEVHGVGGFLGESSESRVSIGTGGPLAVEGGVRFAGARLSAQWVRKSEVPTVGRDG